MVSPENPLSPPQQLAVAYAREDVRHAWGLLLAFDNRLVEIAAKGQEQVLKQLRFAWWREQVSKDADARPKGEPILMQLGLLEPYHDIAARMVKLIDGWEAAISIGDADAAAQSASAARLRSEAIFGAYASWTGADADRQSSAIEAGLTWASAPFVPVVMPALLPGMKPLNLLLLSAVAEQQRRRGARILSASRLYLHALTGL
jgi:15-cis-phytoene synthase